eukprot:comp20375_c0_seq1/m.25747 comp20375_c0_seq1/g.25747  ORF comp20375_c0_seq1/g.25747 comp20375_c0_seq1/m.25747 type:complete len:558 (-) comp20375_c0_seq1:563-2236(-)
MSGMQALQPSRVLVSTHSAWWLSALREALSRGQFGGSARGHRAFHSRSGSRNAATSSVSALGQSKSDLYRSVRARADPNTMGEDEINALCQATLYHIRLAPPGVHWLSLIPAIYSTMEKSFPHTHTAYAHKTKLKQMFDTKEFDPKVGRIRSPMVDDTVNIISSDQQTEFHPEEPTQSAITAKVLSEGTSAMEKPEEGKEISTPRVEVESVESVGKDQVSLAGKIIEIYRMKFGEGIIPEAGQEGLSTLATEHDSESEIEVIEGVTALEGMDLNENDMNDFDINKIDKNEIDMNEYDIDERAQRERDILLSNAYLEMDEEDMGAEYGLKEYAIERKPSMESETYEGSENEATEMENLEDEEEFSESPAYRRSRGRQAKYNEYSSQESLADRVIDLAIQLESKDETEDENHEDEEYEMESKDRRAFLQRQGALMTINLMNEKVNSAPAGDPKSFYYLINRGLQYEKIGKPEMAIADYSAAQTMRPNDPEPFYYRASVYVAMRQLPLAEVDIIAGLRLQPNHMRLRNLVLQFEAIEREMIANGTLPPPPQPNGDGADQP